MSLEKSNKRIWELDFVKGVAIIAVVIIHAVVFINDYSSMHIPFTEVTWFIKKRFGAIFVLVSGICTALSTKNTFKRGLVVFGCGMIISLARLALYNQTQNPYDLTFWGVLHLIGFCMMLYPLIKHIPTPLLFILAVGIIVYGYYLNEAEFTLNPYLYPIGLTTIDFDQWDWFPVLPHLGWFMLGVWIRKTLYKDNESKIPSLSEKTPVINFFCWCGRNSLWIFMIHQPVCYIIAKLIG
ncbi:MAG: heparan-alpha-glucosaminide N-acetyltransferase [Bacillota bacterium]|nr:heparan-alpha-glucosaminide N-acetyltransferase [Bacillota bacterium]